MSSDLPPKYGENAFSFVIDGGLPKGSPNTARYQKMRWSLFRLLSENSGFKTVRANSMGYLIGIMRGTQEVSLPSGCVIEPVEGHGVTFHNPNLVIESNDDNLALSLLRDLIITQITIEDTLSGAKTEFTE